MNGAASYPETESPKDMARKNKRARWWLIPLPLIALLLVAEIILRLTWQPAELYEQHFLQRPFYVVESASDGSKTFITNNTNPESIDPDPHAPPPPPADPRQISPARITVPKAAGTVRIFVMGSSPIYGGPGLSSFSLSTYLERYLAIVRPAQRFEIINAAAQQMSADILRELFDEIGQFDPDFTLVYVGGAVPTLDAPTSLADVPSPLFSFVEGLCKLYLVRVWGPSGERAIKGFVYGVFTFLIEEAQDIESSEINMHKIMLEQSKKQLVDIYADMAKAAAKLPGRTAFYEIVSDLAGSPPLWSLSFKKLDQATRDRFNELLKTAQQHLDAGEVNAAENKAEQALAIDDTFAGAHYLYGLILMRQGRLDEAYEALDLARETDLSHDRLYSVPRRQLAHALAERGLPMLPADRAFRDSTETGIPGKDLFRDITHPTPLGLAVLGRLGAEWILDNLPGDAQQPRPILPTAHELIGPAPPPPIPIPVPAPPPIPIPVPAPPPIPAPTP